MTLPGYQALMLPFLTAAAEGETSELLPSGKQRLLYNRVHWAKFYLSKAGLIESPRRGVFAYSTAGRDLLATRPARINLETLKRYPDFAHFYNQTADNARTADQPQTPFPAPSSEATPEEQIDGAFAVLGQALKADLLTRVLEQSPSFFERLIVELLVAMGYGGSHDDAARQLGKSGDGGIDGVIDEDRLGLDRIYVQAKRYTTGTVGRPEVQGFVGSLVGIGASKGVFVTTSTFSRQALDYVKGLQQRVILIDGARMTELMVEFGVGVRISTEIVIKRIDEDFFSDDA